MSQIEKTLNIAAICPISYTLGPGKRFVIWLQGCCFSCYKCGSPEWQSTKDAIRMSVDELVECILAVPKIEGITISGGEPMLQVKLLIDLVQILKSRSKISIICYTGYLLEYLQNIHSNEIDFFLDIIDVLIDGPYIDSLNDNKGWRGSTNQNVHFLSGLYKDKINEFTTLSRNIEIHLFNNRYLIVGIKPKILSGHFTLYRKGK